jgi:hypothetical protein
MSIICAKAMLDAPNVIAEIQRRALLEYGIISVLLFLRGRAAIRRHHERDLASGSGKA